MTVNEIVRYTGYTEAKIRNAITRLNAAPMAYRRRRDCNGIEGIYRATTVAAVVAWLREHGRRRKRRRKCATA